MISKKKDKKAPAVKKPGKYDITVKLDASFEDLMRAGLGMKKPQQKTA